MAAELRTFRNDLDIDLVESSGGIFEVTYDGKLVFSKKAVNRFPKAGEVSGAIGK